MKPPLNKDTQLVSIARYQTSRTPPCTAAPTCWLVNLGRVDPGLAMRQTLREVRIDAVRYSPLADADSAHRAGERHPVAVVTSPAPSARNVRQRLRNQYGVAIRRPAETPT
jgi:hypothetical protein